MDKQENTNGYNTEQDEDMTVELELDDGTKVSCGK